MRFIILALAVAALAGCDPAAKAGCGSEGSKCDVGTGAETCIATETELGADEVSPLGFSPQDVLDFLAPGFSSTLSWTSGGDTTIAFDFAPGERGYWFADMEDNPEDDVDCAVDDFVYVGVATSWTTGDGSFDGTTDYVVTAAAADVVDALLNPPQDAVASSDCPVGDGFEFTMYGRFDASGAAGTLECEGTGTSTEAAWSP